MIVSDDGLDDIINRVSKLDDDAILELGPRLEELLISRRAAMFRSYQCIRVRFNEPCSCGKQAVSPASPWLKLCRWLRRYDIIVSRNPRRGITLRLVDWRALEWREIVIPRCALKQIVKSLSSVRPGPVRIVALNGSMGDMLDIPSSCRAGLLMSIKTLAVR